MKITVAKKEPVFRPVTITLETIEDLRYLRSLFGKTSQDDLSQEVYKCSAYQLQRETFEGLRSFLLNGYDALNNAYKEYDNG